MATRETTISLPKLGMIAGTRGMLGAGIGILVADRVKAERRKAVGLTLITVGVLSTIPLARAVMRGRHMEDEEKS